MLLKHPYRLKVKNSFFLIFDEIILVTSLVIHENIIIYSVVVHIFILLICWVIIYFI
jgi:hypothetical protein